MKRKALASTCILLLISVAAGMKMTNLAEVNAQETQPQIMSFEEAIDAANTGNYTGSLIVFLMSGEPQGDLLIDDYGVTGFLMWLASNGTFYEVDYLSNRVMGEVGYTIDQDNWVWNTTDPCYIWQLNYDYGEKYWLFANNGTVILHEGPKYGPVPPPSEPSPTILIIASVIIVTVACFGLVLLYRIKRK